MSSFTVQALEEKLSRLSMSQDSIETLSLWIIHHRAHATVSVSVWTDNLMRADADHRLVLLYLANDILQNGRRRGCTEFLDLFREPLKQAAMMARGEKIQTSVERMFRIWKERKVYHNSFLRELTQLIEPEKATEGDDVPVTPPFKLSLLEDAISELGKFEGEMKVKASLLANLRMDVSDTSMLTRLKDKSEGGQFSADFEEASNKLQDYCDCLGVEVNERINMVDMLEDCKTYLAGQLADLRKTVKNYRDLDVLVNGVSEKLQQRVKELARAQQTATSDPGAKEDITDVGDMEIDSDTETTETVDVPKPAPPLSVTNPAPFSQHIMPPTLTPMPPGLAAVVPPRGYPPYPPHPRPGFSQHLPRPLTTSPAIYQSRPSLPVRPRLPVYSQPRPRPLMRPTLTPRPPMTSAARTVNTISAAPVKYATPTTEAPPIPASTAPVQPTAQTSSSQPAAPPLALSTAAPELSSVVEDVSPTSGLPSLEERLKDMVTHHAFPKVLLTGYSDSESEGEETGEQLRERMSRSPLAMDTETERPYSPTGENLIISDPGTPLDKDDEAVPTPPTEIPTPEASPGPLQVNMDNPILQVLFQSQQTPGRDREPPSPIPPTPPALPNLNTGLLQTILSQVSSGGREEPSPSKPRPPTPSQVHQLNRHTPSRTEALEKATPTTPAGGGAGTPVVGRASTVKTPPIEPQSAGKGQGSGGTNSIQITPKLTTLLDEIFPQLSKTLQEERKRKLDFSPAPDAKAQRVEPEPSKPHPLPRTAVDCGPGVSEGPSTGTPVTPGSQPLRVSQPVAPPIYGPASNLGPRAPPLGGRGMPFPAGRGGVAPRPMMPGGVRPPISQPRPPMTSSPGGVRVPVNPRAPPSSMGGGGRSGPLQPPQGGIPTSGMPLGIRAPPPSSQGSLRPLAPSLQTGPRPPSSQAGPRLPGMRPSLPPQTSHGGLPPVQTRPRGPAPGPRGPAPRGPAPRGFMPPGSQANMRMPVPSVQAGPRSIPSLQRPQGSRGPMPHPAGRPPPPSGRPPFPSPSFRPVNTPPGGMALRQPNVPSLPPRGPQAGMPHPRIQRMPRPFPPRANSLGANRFPPPHLDDFPPKPFPPHSSLDPLIPTGNSAPPTATPTNRPAFM